MCLQLEKEMEMLFDQVDRGGGLVIGEAAVWKCDRHLSRFSQSSSRLEVSEVWYTWVILFSQA